MSYFITGTDTNVGKTVVTACLAALFQAKERSVCVYKPVQSGSTDLQSPEDLANILYWLEKPVATANTYNFQSAVAPYAADEKGIIQREVIETHFRALQSAYDVILVEGAGGLRVPLAPNLEMVDLITAFGLPVIVVARPNLGTINHTLLTVEALQRRNVPIKGVIFSNVPENKDPAIQSLPKIMETFLPVSVLAYLPPIPLSQGCLSINMPAFNTPALQALAENVIL